MAEPRFSVSQITTLHQTFEQDLATYRDGGAEGVGIWEFKLPEDKDVESLAQVRDSGLKATTCIPAVFSVYPIPLEGPPDPRERVDSICRSVDRFAPFEPEVVLCLTGYPGDGADPAESRRVVVEGLRRVAQVCAANGLTLGLEPLHREIYAKWSTIGDIPATIELMDEIGEDNVEVLYDVYHLWDTDNVLEDTVRYGSRINKSIHICDWRDPTRNDFDRVLPGDGVIDLPAVFGALEAGGAAAWFDLEIFSDDGTFTEEGFEDSLWKQEPLDVVRRGRAGYERAWAARKVPG